jgi:hypothetical protein
MIALTRRSIFAGLAGTTALTALPLDDSFRVIGGQRVVEAAGAVAAQSARAAIAMRAYAALYRSGFYWAAEIRRVEDLPPISP